MIPLVRRALPATSLVAALSLISAFAASAQSSGPRWQAWTGCWAASAPTGEVMVDLQQDPVICVSPTKSNADAVELATFVNAKLVARDTIDASGGEHVFKTKNCAGSQTARWSSDERRIYLKSTSTCDGLRSTTSAILAIAPNGEWLDVRGVSAGGGENVRVARYHARSVPSAVLDSVASPERMVVSSAARIAAGAPIGGTAVMEATKNVDPSVVESWIMERGQQFSLDAKTLVSLADAGVPARVTDAMIAVSNPGAFKVGRIVRDDDDIRGRRVYGGVMYPSSCDGYDRYYDPYDCRYGRYGYSGYGYGYGGYGYGYGNGYGGYYGPPVVIVSGAGAVVEPKGQAVKGRGYTQTGGTNNGTAQTRDRASTTSTSTSSSPSTSGSSSSGSSSGSSSSSGTERTAHGRP